MNSKKGYIIENNRIDVKFKVFLIVTIVLLSSVLLAGCISQSGSINGNITTETTPYTSLPDEDTSHDDISEKTPIVSDLQSGSEKTAPGDSYFNIRIVPAAVLDNLQKEMGPDEFLVKNEKEYIIGIVSQKGLIIRGDLMQLEQGQGDPGKEFDKTDVALHLLDIAFGLDNAKIALFKSDKDYKFWFDGYYSDAEVKYVKNISRLLNSISGTTQFEDEEVSLGFLQTNYEVVPNNFYNIKIISEKMLKQFFDDRKDTDHLIKDKNGVLIGIVNQDYLYLLDSLTEEDQKYFILKGLFYSMGLHGTSYKNKESFFYRSEGVNRELSDLDIEAIKLLYGGGIKDGETLEDVRKILGLSTT